MKNFKCFAARVLAVALIIAITTGGVSALERAPHRRIRVGYLNYYGMTSSGSGEATEGYLEELLSLIARKTGWEYEFISCEWGEGLKMLEDGQIDLFGPMQKTPERIELYDYPDQPMGVEYGVLFVSDQRDDIYYNDALSMQGMRVATTEGSYFDAAFDTYCVKNGIKITYIQTDVGDYVSGLEQGRFDAVIGGSMFDLPNTVCTSRFASDPFYMATTKGNQEILDEINRAMKAITQDDVYYQARLYEKYYGDKAVSRPAFTREEREYIEAHSFLTVACTPDWSPIEYYDDEQERYRGINIDILEEIGRIAGLEVEFVKTRSYAESIRMVQEGEADLLTGFAQSGQGLGLSFTDAYLEVPTIIVGTGDIDPEAHARIIAYDEGNPAVAKLREQYPNFDVIGCAHAQDVAGALLEGREKFAFMNSYLYNEFLIESQGRQFTTISTGIKIPLKVGISPKLDPMVLDILNKSIKRMPAETKNSIVFSNTTSKSPLPLGAYLRNNMAIVVAGLLLFFAILICIITFFYRRSRRALRQIAYIDHLTGIGTLAKFQADVAQILKGAARGQYTLLSLDVDNFKYINDAFGYGTGNKVLLGVTEHFKLHSDLYCAIGRVSADNYVFLLASNGFDRLQLHFSLLADVAGRMHGILPDSYHLVFSAGAYVLLQPQDDFASHLDRANIARKSIKGGHANTLAEYTAELDRQEQWKKEVTLSMEQSLADHEFVVYLQPKYRLSDGRMAGAEALVRWQHPKRGLLPPGDFIPLFEKNGFIRKLDFEMFDQVCRLYHQWQSAGLPLVPVSINLSRYHLGDALLSDRLLAYATRYGVDPHLIETELTESIAYDNAEALIKTMNNLKLAGFSISIDDFGSGYSSLSLLANLPADVLKIDKAFVVHAEGSENGRRILTKIIEMARSLDLSTVAEGVETEAQMRMLREMGCDLVQGYYFARPLPVEDFVQRLERDAARPV